MAHYRISLTKYSSDAILTRMILLGLIRKEKYFAKADAVPANLAAVVLNPRWKWTYFDGKWDSSQGILARQRLKTYWELRYKAEQHPIISESHHLSQNQSNFELWCELDHVSSSVDMDEYEQYCSTAPELTISDACRWWMETQIRNLYPILSGMALDILSIPAMFAEPECLFSSVKLTVSSLHNCLSDGTIEALEFLKSWDPVKFFISF